MLAACSAEQARMRERPRGTTAPPGCRARPERALSHNDGGSQMGPTLDGWKPLAGCEQSRPSIRSWCDRGGPATASITKTPATMEEMGLVGSHRNFQRSGRHPVWATAPPHNSPRSCFVHCSDGRGQTPFTPLSAARQPISSRTVARRHRWMRAAGSLAGLVGRQPTVSQSPGIFGSFGCR